MPPDSMKPNFAETQISIDLCRLPQIIGSAEAAVLLGCTPEQLTAEIKAGLIPAVKVGRGWRFVTDQLVDCMRSRAESDRKARLELNSQRLHADECKNSQSDVFTPPRRRGRPRKSVPDPTP